MENNKKPRGRPKVLTDEQRKQNKNQYTLTKEWYCDICKNGRDYIMAGKHCHLRTKKHMNNLFIEKLSVIYQHARKPEQKDEIPISDTD